MSLQDKNYLFKVELTFQPNSKKNPDFELEKQAKINNFWPVAGVDEVGRGALAGPVVVAAVILNPERIPSGINDSKRLTHKKRETLYEEICKDSIVAIALSEHDQIDQSNIRKATLDAMHRAILGLAIQPKIALIDGRDIPEGLPCPALTVIKGDSHSLSIAAASIIAKVTRDQIMKCADLEYPGYGFDIHVGYPTSKHLEILKKKGPSQIHRMTFRPLLNQNRK
ncbi:Ribonuclease HII [Liberibacter crescens BT-1]|uniref:Ribonuclease HII n=1 Tax=Liberibacter crescens (strain BT-1) TaxID=1215343 RepID=L0EU28_LIBCB|nr:ribonuclease HII [Liberibacter crescens]AGA64360.1 Ribonuclease HII [Liberibacter crescens BT-1]AMC12554.1 ribonuclease HII [Liberibacter crescens]